VGQHVYPWTVVSVNYHYINATKRLGEFYGLWFNLQTVEDGDLKSAIQMTDVVEAMNSVNSE
jgi:hypothetical protein